MTRIFSRASRALLFSTLVCAAAFSQARADEFSPVPTGDSAYAQLQTLAPTGWIELRPASRAATLTRYEIATETARAILALQAQQSDTKKARPSRAVVRALRELTQKFSPELRSLGIDVQSALRTCDEMLRGESAPRTVAPITLAPAAARTTTLAPRTETSRVSDGARPSNSVALESSLQRLRLDTMVSALSRDALDPFGDTDDIASFGAKLPRGGVALGVSDWLSVRANEGAFRPDGRSLSPFNAPYRARGGEVDVALRGVRLSGAVEQMSPLSLGEAASWNRVGGALGFSAWRNRLTLRANWSRLLPSDARLVPASVGGVDVGLDLSQRLRLTLLYQQMFSGRTDNAPNRVVSTGININF